MTKKKTTENKNILNIEIREDGALIVHFEHEDILVPILSDIITGGFVKGNQRGMNILLATVIHTLARESSGKLEKEFLENLRREIPKYREAYSKGYIKPGKKQNPS